MYGRLRTIALLDPTFSQKVPSAALQLLSPLLHGSQFVPVASSPLPRSFSPSVSQCSCDLYNDIGILCICSPPPSWLHCSLSLSSLLEFKGGLPLGRSFCDLFSFFSWDSGISLNPDCLTANSSASVQLSKWSKSNTLHFQILPNHNNFCHHIKK